MNSLLTRGRAPDIHRNDLLKTNHQSDERDYVSSGLLTSPHFMSSASIGSLYQDSRLRALWIVYHHAALENHFIK